MLAAHQSPLSSSGHQLLIQRPKSGRKPLQPRNPPATPNSTTNIHTPKPKPNPLIETSPLLLDLDIDKENIPPPPIYYYHSTPPVKKIESLQDASLAEELSAIREKLERLRMDKEKTEKMLTERSTMLDLQMKEIHHKAEVQKQLEIEVDRLYRLKEIKLACLQRISPIRTLRDREQEKKTQQHQLQANIKTQDSDEHKEESPFLIPKSEANADKYEVYHQDTLTKEQSPNKNL